MTSPESSPVASPPAELHAASPVAPDAAHPHAAHPHRLHIPTVPEALASVLRTLVIALFVLAFVVQPDLIPSESMEHTLLVGDFLLVNKQIFAPHGRLGGWLMPYRNIERGDIVVFHHPEPHPYLIKRVVGLPGDHLRMEGRQVLVNGVPLREPYAAFEPAAPNPYLRVFPADVYTDQQVDLSWWLEIRSLTHDGEVTVPAGEYFVLGDNRNHSVDSRYWGFVPREAITARPLVIYFSLKRPSSTDVAQAADDRLGHDSELSARVKAFARWKRIFQVVH